MVCSCGLVPGLSAPLIKMPFSAPLPVPTVRLVWLNRARTTGDNQHSNGGNQRHRDVAHDVEPDDKVAIAIAITAGTNHLITGLPVVESVAEP